MRLDDGVAGPTGRARFNHSAERTVQFQEANLREIVVLRAGTPMLQITGKSPKRDVGSRKGGHFS